MKLVKKASVPLTSRTTENLALTGRVLSLGLSEIAYRGQQFSHDFVEITFNYNDEERHITFEYHANGSDMRYGRFWFQHEK